MSPVISEYYNLHQIIPVVAANRPYMETRHKSGMLKGPGYTKYVRPGRRTHTGMRAYTIVGNSIFTLWNAFFGNNIWLVDCVGKHQ